MNRRQALVEHLQRDHGYTPSGGMDKIWERPYAVHERVAPKCTWQPPITAENLNTSVEFDQPFTVGAGGEVTFPREIYSPDVWHVEGASTPHDVEIGGTGWEQWSTGYTGQHGYRGAVLHASEQLAGRIASDLLAQPGTYVVCAVDVLPEDDDDEPEPAGWIILRRAQ